MANTIYSNIVLENAYTSVLTSLLDFNQFLTVDTSLTEAAGMTKRIIKKTVSGSIETPAMGAGNTGTISLSTSYKDYAVKTYQGKGVIYDEEAMSDGYAMDALLKGLAEKLVNSFNSSAVAEWRKATLTQGYTGSISFDTVVDAIAKLNLENEDALFMLVAPSEVAALRKSLKDDLKYSESFVKTGYLGHICGVPVFVSKEMTTGEAIIATKEACRAFVKKNNEVEQKRDADKRETQIFARSIGVVALVNENKVVRIAPQATLTAEAAAAASTQSNG